MLDIINTFLELGDATSENLTFSHRKGVHVNYGEETITETNLLEIRRRHPQLVRIRSFSKPVEAKNGADWEWHVVGRERTLKMRVQAKRLQRNGVLKVGHKVKSSGKQQRDLLIAGARTAGMKPVYCIYGSERQRKIWKQPQVPPGYRGFQAGCLLADAAHVPLSTRRLDDIEEKCRPWHHLFLPATMEQTGVDYCAVDVRNLNQSALSWPPLEPLARVQAVARSEALRWNPPTVDDLNGRMGREFDRSGVAKTGHEDRARLEPDDTEARGRMARADEERLWELGISRLIVIDVRSDPELDQ